jgi:hypothetical protein
MTVRIRLADHARGMEHRDCRIDARRMVNNRFITVNFAVCAAGDTYGTQENGHHAVVAGDRTAGTGGAVYEHCDLRLIRFRSPFLGVLRVFPDVRCPVFDPMTER